MTAEETSDFKAPTELNRVIEGVNQPQILNFFDPTPRQQVVEVNAGAVRAVNAEDAQ